MRPDIWSTWKSSSHAPPPGRGEQPTQAKQAVFHKTKRRILHWKRKKGWWQAESTNCFSQWRDHDTSICLDTTAENTLVRFKTSERWFLPIKLNGQFLGQVFRLFTCFSGELEMSRKEDNLSYTESNNSCVLDCNI